MKRPYYLLIILLVTLLGCDKDKDTTPPVITLIGNNPMVIAKNTGYTEPGAKAIDDVDGDISNKIVITNDVNANVVGTYHAWYNVKDKAGNEAKEVVREIKVMVF